jgi:tetrahydromethanopterin S-methyltransferase subunit G
MLERSGGCSTHSHDWRSGRRERCDDFREEIANYELSSLEGRIDKLWKAYSRNEHRLSEGEKREFNEDMRRLEQQADRLRGKINEGYLDPGEFEQIMRRLDRFEDRIAHERREFRQDVRDGDHCGCDGGHYGDGRPDRGDGHYRHYARVERDTVGDGASGAVLGSAVGSTVLGPVGLVVGGVLGSEYGDEALDAIGDAAEDVVDTIGGAAKDVWDAIF